MNKKIVIEYEPCAPDVKLWLNLQEKFASVFEQMPIILPVPQNAPFEIPRMILNVHDKKGSFACSFDRIELALSADVWNEQLIDDILAKVKPFNPTKIQTIVSTIYPSSSPATQVYQTFKLDESTIPGKIDNLSVTFREKIQFASTSALHTVQIASNYDKTEDNTINSPDSILVKQNVLLDLKNIDFSKKAKEFICFAFDNIKNMSKKYGYGDNN